MDQRVIFTLGMVALAAMFVAIGLVTVLRKKK
jgi:hypothetical protein